MRYRRKGGSAGGARSIGGELMGLSLFVMLLAFFIVLNSISRYEEIKLKNVMESVDSAFTVRAFSTEGEIGRSLVPLKGDPEREEGTLDQIKALFTAQIPGHEIVLNHRKGVMQVTVPFETFESAVMALGEEEREESEKEKGFKKDFLPILVALVRTQKAGMPYKMDILLNMAENPAELQNQSPQKFLDAMEKMSRIAMKIEGAGLPVKQMSVGLQKGEEGILVLLFRPYVPFNPVKQDIPDGP